jgi:DNA-binding NarL/FixJ family response regulator
VIGVVVADREEQVRLELREILAAEADIAVLGETGAGVDVPGLVRRQRPDVLLVDVRMRPPRELAPAVPVLVLTTFGNSGDVYDAMLGGAAGFLLRRARRAEVVAAVRTVASGEAVLFPAAVRDLVATQGRCAGTTTAVAFTERENAVLRSMARGLTDAEIARYLGLPAETVASDVACVRAGLGARDRTQAVVRAYETGVLDPRSPPD